MSASSTRAWVDLRVILACRCGIQLPIEHQGQHAVAVRTRFLRSTFPRVSPIHRAMKLSSRHRSDFSPEVRLSARIGACEPW